MTVTGDIFAVWRAPRAAVRAKLAQGEREDRALATVMGAAGLMFVAQWPSLSRAAHLDPSVPLDARMGITLFAMLFMVPLIAYGIAGLSHLAFRAAGGRGSHYGARLALFWAMLAIAPAMLFHGLVRGFLGDSGASVGVGLLVLGAFLYLWGSMLVEVERG